jgi:hypothetical protein
VAEKVGSVENTNPEVPDGAYDAVGRILYIVTFGINEPEHTGFS